MRQLKLDYERLESMDWERWERIRNRRKAAMPVRMSLSATRGMHKTTASRRASRRISKKHGGIHRRRYRQMM